MKLDLNVKMSQEQRLIMTQNMQQSIKLLQMSLYDLREHITNEYSENPILEVNEERNNDETSENQYSEIDHKKLVEEFYEDYRDNTEKLYSKEEDTSPLNFIANKKSLNDFLQEQLCEINENPYIINICKYVIESLDNRGYLEIETNELSEELNIPIQDIEKALNIVQDLEPYGIGARNIKECLLIQSKKLNILDDVIENMINNHLENIAVNKYDLVGKDLNISTREAQRYGDIIKKLEPKPSRGFYTGDEVNYIIPDAEIKNIDGEFFIIMNESMLPKLTINKMYKNVLENDKNSEVGEYVKDKINSAVFLIKAIEQRKNTLYRVLEILLKKQNDFFKNGFEHLKPLTLKEVADEIKMHESTVSRAVKDKYVLTSFGTIKIKDLFASSANNSNIDMAALKVKNAIKKIIDGEDSKKPFSDQIISEKLAAMDINISRRTVAKYREEMEIKPSVQRKRI